MNRLDDNILITGTMLGLRYTRICTRHQWASVTLVDRELCADCPECLVETDAGRGHDRYRSLHQQLTAPREEQEPSDADGEDFRGGERQAYDREQAIAAQGLK